MNLLAHVNILTQVKHLYETIHHFPGLHQSLFDSYSSQ